MRKLNLPPTPQLQPCKRRILELLVQCYSNEDIADTLDLALSTVKNYNGMIYRTMGFRHRCDAVAWAWKNQE
uniref:Putative LuxR-type DNA-binding HTH domain containing protein n=1 Tax=viral metagenome TaxID=1070528 RepID=A0A6M3K9D3_9ZZZZ